MRRRIKLTYCTLKTKVETTASIKIPCFHRSSWPVSIRHLHIRELESYDKTRVRTGRVARPECRRIHRHGFLSFNDKNKINLITWCSVSLCGWNTYISFRLSFFIRTRSRYATLISQWNLVLDGKIHLNFSSVFSVAYSNVWERGNNVPAWTRGRSWFRQALGFSWIIYNLRISRHVLLTKWLK